MLAIFGCVTVLLKVWSVGGKTTVTYPEVQPVYAKYGGRLELTCEQSEGFKIQWLKADRSSHEYKVIDSNDDTGIVFLSRIEGKEVVQLIKYIVTMNDEGSYKCAVVSGTDMPYAVEVYVVQVSEKPGLITHPGNTTTLSCAISATEKVGVEMHWLRHNRVLHSATNEKKYNISVIETDNTTELLLTVRSVGEADIGIYQCNITLKNGNNFTHNINLYAYPQVKSMGRSKNLVAGQDLELDCKAWGWPEPNVTWDFERGPLNWSDTRISPAHGVLKITDIAASDRAVYVCTAWNNVSNAVQKTRNSILVRVKGKFAVLWPLIGIAVEVVVLTCIIYVYERNRARQRAEQERKEAADHQSNSNAQTRHQGRDNVRYRK